MSATEEAGYTFLASLGKTRLHLGGVKATEWLFSQSQLTPDSQALEVTCDMATTAIELVQRYGCTTYATDMDKTASSNARNNAAVNDLKDHIHVMVTNANTLPFADNSSDVVINEAMLATYIDKAKVKLITEYYRVLKPDGRLLIHDIMLTTQKLGVSDQDQLADVVKSNVSPMTRQGWRDLFLNCGLEQVL